MSKVNGYDFSRGIVDEVDNEQEHAVSIARINIDEYLIRHLSIAVTNKCNLSCEYCYKSVQHDGCIMEIPFEKIRKYIDDFDSVEVHGNKVQTVQLIGGEPTLHENFIDICRHIIQKGLQLRISTNGTNTKLLQSLEMQELCRMGAVEFRVSLDEIPSKRTTRGRGGNTNVIGSNIEFLVKHGNNVSIKSVITRQNIDYISDMLEYLHAIGVKNFSYSSLYNLGNANNERFYKSNYVSDLEIYLKVLSIIKLHPEYAPMLQANIVFHMLTSIFVKHPPYFFTKFYAYVHYDGNIYPQDQLVFDKFKLGSIYDYKINNIISALRDMKEKYELRKAHCLKCFGYPYCTKGNYGELFLMDHSMNDDFPTCNNLRALMDYLMTHCDESLNFFRLLFYKKW